MVTNYSLPELLMYLMIYSFAGWVVEVLIHAVRDKHFVNGGILNLPFSLPAGITALILMLVLPTMNGSILRQFIVCYVVQWAVKRISEHVLRRIRGGNKPQLDLTRKERMIEHVCMAAAAAVYMIVYLLIHPLLFGVRVMPRVILNLIVIVWVVLLAADLICVLYTLRTSNPTRRASQNREHTSRLASKIVNSIRNRLEKNYPGILNKQGVEKNYVFAEGLCLDKLVWVFLVSSFLGALIEMVYCRVMGDAWMNRSSLLYGNFSVVWGLGAVILTITLQRLADRSDRYVFMAGFVVGGVYEYLCSVFTELVFGTVFWDYSWMPLNIGGRTNVMYCIFWGILAVVWVKVIYPPMSRGIEKIPTLPGKIVTWVLVFLLICDGILTMGAMIRYTDRQTSPEPENLIEEFYDERYDNAWMENRWPNMKITAEAEEME